MITLPNARPDWPSTIKQAVGELLLRLGHANRALTCPAVFCIVEQMRSRSRSRSRQAKPASASD